MTSQKGDQRLEDLVADKVIDHVKNDDELKSRFGEYAKEGAKGIASWTGKSIASYVKGRTIGYEGRSEKFLKYNAPIAVGVGVVGAVFTFKTASPIIGLGLMAYAGIKTYQSVKDAKAGVSDRYERWRNVRDAKKRIKKQQKEQKREEKARLRTRNINVGE